MQSVDGRILLKLSLNLSFSWNKNLKLRLIWSISEHGSLVASKL